VKGLAFATEMQNSSLSLIAQFHKHLEALAKLHVAYLSIHALMFFLKNQISDWHY
jgi:hypothetical protein